VFQSENLIGEENHESKVWTYAKFLLGNERTSMAGNRPLDAHMIAEEDRKDRYPG